MHVEKLIKLSSSAKSCASDPLRIWMAKQCLYLQLPFITNIVNLFLPTGSTLPNQIKSTVITPILSKASLDPSVLKNFRLVANVAYPVQRTRDVLHWGSGSVNHSIEFQQKLTQQRLIRTPTRLNFCPDAVKTKRGNYNVGDQKMG